MTAQLLNGKELALRLNADIRREVAELAADGVQPRLVAVQLGDPAASRVYTRSQAAACEDVGVGYELKILPADIGQADLLGAIASLNDRDDVTGAEYR